MFWPLNCVLMLNWIVLNRRDYLHKNGFGVKITYKGWYAIKHQQTNQPTISLSLSLLFPLSHIFFFFSSHLSFMLFLFCLFFLPPSNPVSWGYRIHWLHLCKMVRPPTQMSVLIMTLNHLMMRFQTWIFGECRVSFMVITPRSTLTQTGSIC